MVYAEFGGQTECIMGNWKIENSKGIIALPRLSLIGSCRNYYVFKMRARLLFNILFLKV